MTEEITNESNRVRLIEIVEEASKLFQSLPNPDLDKLGLDRNDEKSIEYVVTAFAWTNRAIRNCMVAILAAKQGFKMETSPLIRSAIEHGVCVHWLHELGLSAMRVLTGEKTRSTQKLKKSQENGWVFDSPEIQEMLEEFSREDREVSERTLDSLMHFAHRAKAVNMGNELQAWLISTMTSHATLGSAKGYFYVSDLGEVTLLHSPTDSHIEIEVQAALASITAITGYIKFIHASEYVERVATLNNDLISILNKPMK